MKNFFLLLISFCFFLNINAQKKYENSYLIMNIPKGWEAEKMDVSGANMELLYFCNSGDYLYNLGMVIGVEQMIEPISILQTQMDLKNNLIFKNAKFGAIHKSSFMGKAAQSVDFDTMIDNEKFKGAAYAFNEGDCSIVSIGCYKVGVKSNLPQIWRSIKWKYHKKDGNKYKNLREEVEAFSSGLNKLWKQSPIVNNGEQAISLDLEEGEDCLVYTYRLVEYSKTQFTEEQLAYIQETVRKNLIPLLKTMAAQTNLIKRCMDEEYVFKYIYQDKEGNFFFYVKITPDDYK